MSKKILVLKTGIGEVRQEFFKEIFLYKECDAFRFRQNNIVYLQTMVRMLIFCQINFQDMVDFNLLLFWHENINYLSLLGIIII